MRQKYRCVLFDLDGTLTDTLGDIAASANKALKLRGFPELPVEAYRDKVGWGIKRLAFLALPEEARDEERAAQIAADAARFYAETPLDYTRPYPGVLSLVAALRQRKLKTAVLTNKPDPVAQKVVSGLFPAGSFDMVQGETHGRPRKPDPASVWELLVAMDLNPADVIFAGDSEVDMETAVSSGCFALGVSWGYRSRAVIEKAGAKRIINTPDEVLELL